jgi:hypothetical protein
MVSLRRNLRDARFQRAPQDEVLFRGEILDPHGEERRLRRVSNLEAEYAIGPYAIALPLAGRGSTLPARRQLRPIQENQRGVSGEGDDPLLGWRCGEGISGEGALCPAFGAG